MLAITVLFASGAYKFTVMGFTSWPLNDMGVRWGIACVITLVGWWFAFRLVHFPTFADFLVSVEAEMLKVSWPSNTEVHSSTLVVLAMFLILSALIYGFDLIWIWFFQIIRIIPT